VITAGIDIGSLTAKAVILQGKKILGYDVMRVRARVGESAEAVLSGALIAAGVSQAKVQFCCSTGYGRFEIPSSQMNMSEISCHGRGAFWARDTVRTVIDIGGQDCKIVCLDDKGRVRSFLMNNKCAAGTGRSLELLSKSIGLSLGQLGTLSLRSRKRLQISNKCSIFMEMEVLQHLYKRNRRADIAYAINDAVAKRVVQMAHAQPIESEICITGGVSKNVGVVKILEELLRVRFCDLPVDPQIMGALGAAVFAQDELAKQQKEVA